MQKTTPETTPERVVEHHPACKGRCVSACGASPRRSKGAAWHRVPPDTLRARVRTFHVAPVSPLTRPPRPLWEHIDDFEAVRRSGCPIPLPETYTAHERADERYSLDRWTRPDGLKDRELDAVHARLAEERKSHVRSAPDVDDVAALIRGAFPAAAHRVAKSPPPRVRKHASRTRITLQDMLDALMGDEPQQGPAGSEYLIAQGGIYVGLVWGLALILFGRERDTVSEHALGRMLPGEPVRDLRPPFASAAHVLAVADHALPGLGGGSCPWPQDDPRMAKRTWSRPDEMKVSAAHHGTDSIRGEAAVHRVLDARNAARRAALEPHEHAAVAILNDRTLTRDERVLRLREVEAIRRGIDPASLVTPESARRAEVEFTLWRVAVDEHYRQLAAAPDDAAAAKLREAWQKRRAERTEQEQARQAIDALARPALLRDATADVSDADLFRAAKAAEGRVREAVERVSRAGDALAPKREERRPAPTFTPRLPARTRADLAMGCL